MTTVRMWSGREARALREAKRMTIREFAAHLGVSERTVSKWESGAGDIQPRPEMQAALDTALERASDEVTARFLQALGEGGGPSRVRSAGFVVQSHKFIPVYIGVEAARVLGSRRSFNAQLDSWLRCRAQPLQHPDGRATVYVFACGAAVVHIRQRCDMGYIADLATWRYATIGPDRQWVTEQLTKMLPEHELGQLEPATWLCWLEKSAWSDIEQETALRLICMPSVLVDRDAPDGPRPVAGLVEQWHLTTNFEHPDVIPFGVRGLSVGYAAWSGRSYLAATPRRALTIEDLIANELQIQMLLCYARWIQLEGEAGRTPKPPDEYGFRYLRAARSRLTTPLPGETLQHRLMRDTLVRVTGLPDRLRVAQELLSPGCAIASRGPGSSRPASQVASQPWPQPT